MSHRTHADLGIIRPSDVEPEPWANGLGLTRVLAARPAWRISLAEIEGRMPFSPFLGADRVLIPLSAPGVTIEIDGVESRVPARTGIAFRGEEHVVAETDGRRIAVVNLMMRRSSGRMRWEIRQIAGRIDTDADAAVVLRGRVSVGSESFPAGTVLGQALIPQITVRPSGAVALVRVKTH